MLHHVGIRVDPRVPLLRHVVAVLFPGLRGDHDGGGAGPGRRPVEPVVALRVEPAGPALDVQVGREVAPVGGGETRGIVQTVYKSGTQVNS